MAAAEPGLGSLDGSRYVRARRRQSQSVPPRITGTALEPRLCEIEAPRGGSVTEPGLLDVVVVHAEVVADLVQHRVVHLVDKLVVRPAPSLDVVLQ